MELSCTSHNVCYTIFIYRIIFERAIYPPLSLRNSIFLFIGSIYEIKNRLYDAYGAIKKHIENDHISPIDYLFTQHTALLGISESQRDVLKGMWENKSDKEIANACNISPSTVRNYKFKFREKQRQAKAYLALLEEIQRKLDCESILEDNCVEVHDSAKMVDERFSITKEEYAAVVSSYIKERRKLLF